MTTTGGVHVNDWVVHRPNVVRSVAARVPGIDAEEATSRALEKMVRIVSTGGTIDDPAPYWRRAAVNEAISMTREAGRAHPVEDDTLADLTPPVAGAELDAERQADVSMLRTALADLADDDRQILLERHVHDRAVTDIATGLGVRPHAVTMRLRRAEERLAGAFAAAHAHNVTDPECRTTRAAMHDYLKGRLLPRRQRRLEVHMDGCTECTRAFVDVREVSWMLRDLGQHFIGGVLVTGAVGGGIGGAVSGGAVGAAGGGAAGARTFGKKETGVAAGVIVALAVGGVAAAYLANQGDQPPAQAIVDLSGGGADPLRPPAQDLPPSIPPADPQPRPAEPEEEPVLEPVTAPERDVSEPTPAPEPEPRPAPEPAPAREPEASPAEPAPPKTPAVPAPEQPAAQPAPAPEPEPEAPPAPEPPAPEPPAPEPPAPAPPAEAPQGGPPGNPDNEHGKGPAKDNGQGPGNGNGQGSGGGNGNGAGNGAGNGQGKGKGNGNGKGKAPNSAGTEAADLGEQLTGLLALPSVAGASGVVLLGGPRHPRRRPDAAR